MNPISYETVHFHSAQRAWAVVQCPTGHIYFGQSHRHSCPKCGRPLYMQNATEEEYLNQREEFFSLRARLLRFFNQLRDHLPLHRH